MLLTTERLKKLKLSQHEKDIQYKPIFYRLSDSQQSSNFYKLLKVPGLLITDYLLEQIRELIRIKNPSIKFTDSQLTEEALKHIYPLDISEYGVWVYYPWSNRLVHIPDENEFIEIRTSRNQYKITKEERDILGHKIIGVIGLSVGQSVSVTICLERICGEIRLADFDRLELTNLNRIRTGIHNLNLPKVYAVAREIAEIDPFIKVVCYPEGITEQSMDDFFTKDGKLSLMIEESDGFDIKILSRIKARELKIPVLMEASDRCMVDVERFDLEPNRSILHGLVDHLDLETLKKLKTNEEKIPYMLDILGLETSSTRLKASMLEIDQSINTWPQLASAVTMGGGITADVARRLLLGYYNSSGRYHIDIEELIGDEVNSKTKIEQSPKFDEFDYLSYLKNKFFQEETLPLDLDEAHAKLIVEAATLAPSGGNLQPWRWVYKNHSLYLFNAFDSSDSFMGFNHYASYIALGASIENAVLKAKEIGFDTIVDLFPDKNELYFIAKLKFKLVTQINPEENNLAKGIPLRLTNRKITIRESLDNTLLDKIQKSVNTIDGAEIKFFSTDEELKNIGNVLGEIEQIRIIEEQGHHDFVNEIRWTIEENELKRDGVDLRTIDITNSEKVGLEVSKDKNVINLLRKWNGGGAFKKLTCKSIDSAAAVGVLSMKGNLPVDYVSGGRALQRAWLTANLNQIAFQPTASSLFIYARLLGGGKNISNEGAKKLNALRPQYEQAFNLTSDKKEIFFFRLLKAKNPEVKSLRKPINEIYKYLGND